MNEVTKLTSVLKINNQEDMEMDIYSIKRDLEQVKKIVIDFKHIELVNLDAKIEYVRDRVDSVDSKLDQVLALLQTQKSPAP